jgi:hypothetical protein
MFKALASKPETEELHYMSSNRVICKSLLNSWIVPRFLIRPVIQWTTTSIRRVKKQPLCFFPLFSFIVSNDSVFVINTSLIVLTNHYSFFYGNKSKLTVVFIWILFSLLINRFEYGLIVFIKHFNKALC